MKTYRFKINGKDYDVAVNGIEGRNASVTVNGAAAPKASGAGKDIVSPLPGVVISVDVKVGDAVKRGQKVAVIEAMKMENEILADCDGSVTAVHVSKGDSVLEDAKIVTVG